MDVLASLKEPGLVWTHLITAGLNLERLQVVQQLLYFLEGVVRSKVSPGVACLCVCVCVCELLRLPVARGDSGPRPRCSASSS